MRKILVLAAAAALTAGLASSAFADMENGGFYVGVNGGYNKAKLPTGNFSSGTVAYNAKLDKYVANVHVGYVVPVADQFQLGGQVGYSYYGKYKISGNNTATTGTASVKLSSLNLQAVGLYNIQQWFVKGHVGGAYMNDSESGSVTVDGTSYKVNSKSAWKVIAGLAVGYYFTDNFSGEVFYDHIFGKSWSWNNIASLDSGASDSAPTMNAFGVGVNYSF